MLGLIQIFEQKKEIDSAVDKLRIKYHLPSEKCSLLDLEYLATDLNIQVDFCQDAITAYNERQKSPERSYVILPNMGYPTNVRNLAHELGHIILDTDSELKVEYFSHLLTGENIISNQYQTCLDALKYMILLIRRYQDNPLCSEKSWNNLRMRGVPEPFIDFIKADYEEMEPKIKLISSKLKRN